MYKDILHVSFDFWGTIGLSNLEFKNARRKLIKKINNNISEIEIDKAFTKIGDEYNIYQEQKNITKHPKSLLKSVFDELKISDESFLIDDIYNGILIEFDKFPPHLNKKAMQILEDSLKEKKSLSILSNTAFIPGESISNYLEKNIGIDVFIFSVFSDVVNLAKPNNEIFSLCVEKINTIKEYQHSLNSILHIGDDIQNDYEAGKRFGVNTYLLK